MKERRLFLKKENGFNRYMVECEYVHKKESDDMRKSF